MVVRATNVDEGAITTQDTTIRVLDPTLEDELEDGGYEIEAQDAPDELGASPT
jgi:hypothetical protein